MPRLPINAEYFAGARSFRPPHCDGCLPPALPAFQTTKANAVERQIMNTLRQFGLANLRELDACRDACDWVAGQTGSAAAIWDCCERSDWMLWLLNKIQPLTREQAVTLACRFALEVLPIFEGKFPDDKRPRLAIEAAQALLTQPNAAYAADAAYAARKRQAQIIREIVGNPFK